MRRFFVFGLFFSIWVREVGYFRCFVVFFNVDFDVFLFSVEENEERTMIDFIFKEDFKFKELVKVRRGVFVGMIFLG